MHHVIRVRFLKQRDMIKRFVNSDDFGDCTDLKGQRSCSLVTHLFRQDIQGRLKRIFCST